MSFHMFADNLRYFSSSNLPRYLWLSGRPLSDNGPPLLYVALRDSPRLRECRGVPFLPSPFFPINGVRDLYGAVGRLDVPSPPRLSFLVEMMR